MHLAGLAPKAHNSEAQIATHVERVGLHSLVSSYPTMQFIVIATFTHHNSYRKFNTTKAISVQFNIYLKKPNDFS